MNLETENGADARLAFEPLVRRLAKAHWDYVSGVLRAHGEAEDVIEKCGHHYRAAFEHGWKHANEETAKLAEDRN
jgi:hypothetical protein